MSARNFYIMQSAVAPMQSELPCYTPLTNHRTEVHTVPLVMAADYDALHAEAEALRAQRDKMAQILRDLVPGCKWRFMRPRIDQVLQEVDGGN